LNHNRVSYEYGTDLYVIKIQKYVHIHGSIIYKIRGEKCDYKKKNTIIFIKLWKWFVALNIKISFKLSNVKYHQLGLKIFLKRLNMIIPHQPM
jgi:hypothetical protein